MKFSTQKNDLAHAELKALGRNIRKVGEGKFTGIVSCYQRLAYTKKVYFDNVRWANREPFHARRAHLRPGRSGHSLDPRLARLLVNLTGIRRGKLLDPFCGTGGFLIEAGLMGLDYQGYDIDVRSVEKAKKNLLAFGLEPAVEVKDALSISKSFSYLVTDLPYGRASKVSKDLELLYADFARMLAKKLRKRAVIVSPHFLDFSQFVKKEKKLKVVQSFDIYVHKSLTRKIAVIERR
jgi:tRNA (guanine10-N2)-dimethyltransferase